MLQHAVNFMEDEGMKIDGVVLCNPPLRSEQIETIKKCVEAFKAKKDADSVVTVNNIEGFRPEWMLSVDVDKKNYSMQLLLI